ncbi:MAG: hypothetical protein PHT32_05390, partial [Candidatus Omnitrophica bacterium]|nr:hypothetical protein [Candidatus Omnitrophota bacterium]
MSDFGFIAHPIDNSSFLDLLGGWGKLVGFLPIKTIRDISVNLSPYILCNFKKIRSAKGITRSADIACVPLLPIQIASIGEDRALNIIEKAVKICEKRGAKVVGLAGFTSVVGNEGEVLSKRVKVPLTSGNTLTAVLALDGIYKAARLMDITLENSIIAVIGATGDIGSICTKMLAKRARKINISARNEKRLEDFATMIKKDNKADVEVFKYTKDAIKEADIILTATSSVTTIIEPSQLKPGAIVCDVALPANIAKEVVKMRDDVLVFEGGLAKMPYMEDIRHKRLARLVPINGVYGCAAETTVLSFEDRYEPYSLGRGNITEANINEMRHMAM